MEFNLPSEVSGAGCSLQWVSWAWGVGMDRTWGAWSSAWGGCGAEEGLVVGVGRVGGAEEGLGLGRVGGAE